MNIQLTESNVTCSVCSSNYYLKNDIKSKSALKNIEDDEAT